MSEVDVAIIGAGAAGLAAAAALRGAGRRTLILEAAAQPGGRARTTRPAALGGAWLDEGAAWIHMAETNPVVPMAEARRVPLKKAFRNASLMFVQGRAATATEHAEYDAASARWEAIVMAAPAVPDRALAAAIGPFRHENPWAPTIEAWEASLIQSVDAPYLSLADFRLNQLDGTNLMPPEGFGQLLLDLLLDSAGPIRVNCPATRIDWSGPHLRIDTPEGVVTAAQVIVTVSTGVLQAGGLRFTPSLPPQTAQAIDDLPMGLLSKIVARAAGADRLGMTATTHLFRRRESLSAPFLSTIAWPRGTDHVIAFVGGDAAWAVAEDPRAADSLFRAEWRAMLGSEADRIFAPGGFTTDWATDPHHLGAYSYARPGAARARALLSEPVGEGRLLFAGEACRTDGTAGTVGGAVSDGRRAAAIILGQEGTGHL
ncbi:MAG TPA: NAD(P)/FAD-dependent oxidoreductase [Acidisoma sp.]|uniref:flavin monoamine oxidase family protein n=1 Tax=Acidisoma sp. TaxID=1872115 RepID=UPI002CF2D792|nr:NAD(P)/FAD-dependent oxidoreductase [Acidisoma sp.]HTH99361.1 NAD(P)/FAD-dependent oxidoreductase [Acidisoma sp.]